MRFEANLDGSGQLGFIDGPGPGGEGHGVVWLSATGRFAALDERAEKEWDGGFGLFGDGGQRLYLTRSRLQNKSTLWMNGEDDIARWLKRHVVHGEDPVVGKAGGSGARPMKGVERTHEILHGDGHCCVTLTEESTRELAGESESEVEELLIEASHELGSAGLLLVGSRGPIQFELANHELR